MNYKTFSTRLIVALLYGPLVLFLNWKGGYFLFALVLIVSTVSYWEYFRLAKKKGADAQLVSGELLTAALIVALYCKSAALLQVILAGAICIFFIELYRKKSSPILNVAATLFGSLFFSLLFGTFLLIRDLPFVNGLADDEAGQWLIMLILATWVCDSAAYIVGSYFGRHKLMPRISPNKSVEGSVAGFLFAILAAYICHQWFIDELSPLDSMAIGAIAGSFGQYGDLFESMFKRDADVKDTSKLLPEHGGMMDRFDSLTISAPIMYLYLVHFVF
ncbi:phosphatidate cytidylyltransferase [candidate division KSB1 bacterium]|nr:phosphatidate cytidylyltransferase [candidate division KSB1 bacterium]